MTEVIIWSASHYAKVCYKAFSMWQPVAKPCLNTYGNSQNALGPVGVPLKCGQVINRALPINNRIALNQECKIKAMTEVIIWLASHYGWRFVVLERDRVVPENINLVTILKTQTYAPFYTQARTATTVLDMPINHVLLECKVFNNTRKHYFHANTMNNLFENVHMDDVLSFFKETGLYKKI